MELNKENMKKIRWLIAFFSASVSGSAESGCGAEVCENCVGTSSAICVGWSYGVCAECTYGIY